MTGSWIAVAAALGLVALNGFFVATEFALVKVTPTRLELEAGSAASIGGLVIEKLRRIPVAGDEVAIGPFELKVEGMDGPRIVALSARRAGP
ncbi:MAG: transporter associated domain-containing protein [Myxococcales bacterium]